MLNFKKAGIFSRGSGQEDACEQEDQSGGVLAVWGSPGSGKTTVAVRLAKYLADKRRNVILLLCDMTAPMLPCICPAADLECERSLGSVLAAAHVSENLVKNNLVTHKRLGYLTMLGMPCGMNCGKMCCAPTRTTCLHAFPFPSRRNSSGSKTSLLRKR